MSNAREWDNPDSVYSATVIVSDYGAVLDETSIFALGVSEKRLPHQKQEIEVAIEFLLRFLNNKGSWDKLKQRYPEIVDEILTDRYRNALETGYMELARFVPDDEAKYCEEASLLLQEPLDQGRTIDEILDELKSKLSWFQRVIEINKRISEDSSSRLKRLQDKFAFMKEHD
jgi:hypothetical protein